MKKSFDTGIVILNYNTPDDTKESIASVKRYSADGGYHIYAVDNGSPDGSGESLREIFKDDPYVTVILTDRNLGFSGGNNEGIKAALSDGCEYIFLINSDVCLDNDAIGSMREAFDRYEEAAAAAPYVRNLSGSCSQFARKKLTFRSHMAERLHLPQTKGLREYDYDREHDFVFDGMSGGCCFGLRADFIRASNAMDDNIFLFYEEDILAWMLAGSGRKAVIVSSARVTHAEGKATAKSSGGKVAFERLYRWTSALYVLKKYAGVKGLGYFMVKLLDVVEWRLLSLSDKSYRQYGNLFRAELKRVERL